LLRGERVTWEGDDWTGLVVVHRWLPGQRTIALRSQSGDLLLLVDCELDPVGADDQVVRDHNVVKEWT
jgi:hypothetical protein